MSDNYAIGSYLPSFLVVGEIWGLLGGCMQGRCSVFEGRVLRKCRYDLQLERKLPHARECLSEVVFALPPCGDLSVADICAGSGRVATSILQAYPTAYVCRPRESEDYELMPNRICGLICDRLLSHHMRVGVAWEHISQVGM